MHAPAHDPALTAAVALAAGVVAQAIARWLSIPGIVVLLAFGVSLGPEVLGIVQPSALGPGLHTIVGLSVAVILFEGGMSLDLRRLRREAASIQRLTTLGAALTAVGATLAARASLGWPWRQSLLFGTLVIVTGPTVITPLLRRIRVSHRVHTVLEAEGVLIDAVGALIAVVTLEVMLGPDAEWVRLGLLGLSSRWAAGLLLGAVAGLAVGLPLKYHLVPRGLSNIYALASAVAVFAAANALAEESGILAVIVAGMVVANLRPDVQRELLEFKEQLTVLLVGMLFVLLAADVRLAEVTALGPGGAACVAALMLLVRPLTVAACTAGSKLSLRERAFVAWLGPRGIVAAAVASLFAQTMDENGIPGGQSLRAMVFLVIAATVVIQGSTGALVAGWLGVRRPSGQGVLILGAGGLARLLARELRRGGEEVILIDANPAHCRAAEEEGHRVIYGNALDERTLRMGEPEIRRACLGLTRNEGVNLLFARRVREELKAPSAAVAVHRGRVGLTEKDVERAGASVLFGGGIELDAWSGRCDRGAVEVLWHAAGGAAAGGERPPDTLLVPAVVSGRAGVDPFTSSTRLRAGDRVGFLAARERLDEARRWLEEHGWSPAAA